MGSPMRWLATDAKVVHEKAGRKPGFFVANGLRLGFCHTLHVYLDPAIWS